MRKDKCLFCSSIKCYTRIVSCDDGKMYDEVACNKHSEALHKHSDEVAPNVMKMFESGIIPLKRGEPLY